MPASDKAAIRRALRDAYDEQARRQESRALCRHILAWPEYRKAQVVAGYVPIKREADITPVLKDVLATGRTLALPRTGPLGQMAFYSVKCLEELTRGQYGILEPPEKAEAIPPEALQLTVVPLEAMTRQGMRMGKGGGYYDRLLARYDMLTLGAVMSWQWVDSLPADPWDKPLKAAADAWGIHLFDGFSQR